jgi:hypothetical protein
MPKPKGRGVSVVALDLGSTTGIVVVTIDKAWLRGMGDPTWAGLGHAVKIKTAYQTGREPKTFDLDKGRSTRLDRAGIEERLLPILASQPLVVPDGMRSSERFEQILDGRSGVCDGGLLMVDAEEVVQVRQICGLLDNYADAAWVVEDFTLRTDVRSREVTSSDRLRASVVSQEILHGEGRIPFLQQASMAKTTATDERLKRADLYFPGMPHATDAARHAMTFLRRARQSEEVRAAAWPLHFKDEFDSE